MKNNCHHTERKPVPAKRIWLEKTAHIGGLGWGLPEKRQQPGN
jgi:hypothetical protein